MTTDKSGIDDLGVVACAIVFIFIVGVIVFTILW